MNDTAKLITIWGVFVVAVGLVWMLGSYIYWRIEQADRKPIDYEVITTSGTVMNIVAYNIEWNGGWIGFENKDGEYYRILPAHRVSEIRQPGADFPYRTTEGVVHV